MHLSGGVGIGGVLEPLQASPTIIEDNCFIGARSEIVEGVIVEEGAVISMGVFIGQSTRIYDRERDEVLYGRVPAGAVVVPGTLPAAERQVRAVLRRDREARGCARPARRWASTSCCAKRQPQSLTRSAGPVADRVGQRPRYIVGWRTSSPLSMKSTCSATFFAWSPMRSSPLRASTVSMVVLR